MSATSTRCVKDVKNGPLIYPESLYDGWTPSAHETSEQDLLDCVARSRPVIEQGDYITVDINDFAIYRTLDAALNPGQFICLSALRTEHYVEELLIDGAVSLGRRKFYLRRLKFSILSVDGYGDTDSATVRHGIFIQTPLAAANRIWYRLQAPAQQYRRYHDVFRWVADLAKFFVEFMSHDDVNVSLSHFRRDFIEWATQAYAGNLDFKRWQLQLKGSDFRSAICAHMRYLWKEAFSVVPDLQRHALWAEIGPFCMTAIRPHVNLDALTIVTPLVDAFFKHMYFNPILGIPPAAPFNVFLADKRAKLLGLTPKTSLSSDMPNPISRSYSGHIWPGDFVCLEPDNITAWPSGPHAHWYAYVQSTRALKDGRVKLDLLWLYTPSDTLIGTSRYPFKNELFLSDNCACGRDAYDSTRVVGRIKVMFGRDPRRAQKQSAFILRQTYMTNTHEFVSFDPSHLTCRCRHPPPDHFLQARADFKEGDFALYRSDLEARVMDPILRPAQILKFLEVPRSILCRRLGSAANPRHQSTINQILWSDETFTLDARALVRPCIVKGFPNRVTVEPLFLRGGVGDLFYYLYSRNDPNVYADVSKTSRPAAKLRGMGICCGGGSLDRGLEDGGAVEFQHAIDSDEIAIHTYRANSEHPDKINFFQGPMEMYLRDAVMDRKTTYPKAAIGDVDIIAAGSPCQAFSLMQSDRFSETSVKHASLVANVVAYVDHFMPLYLIFENVLGIAHVLKGLSQDQNILTTMLGCLVGMGYQTQQVILDVPAFNGFQSRRRCFVIATAPGLDPLHRPPQTSLHSRFKNASLGRLPTGLPLAAAQDELAPFPMTTFAAATADLPDIGDGHVHACISHPDHRLARQLSADHRTLLSHIRPGSSLRVAHAEGRLPPSVARRWKVLLSTPGRNTAFSRVPAHGLCGVIKTRVTPVDRFGGQVLHPAQDRVLSVLEARRAQGWPDGDVLLGSPAQQWKIVGNGVHRNVAFALGLELEKAVGRSMEAVKKRREGGVRIVVGVLVERSAKRHRTEEGDEPRRTRQRTKVVDET